MNPGRGLAACFGYFRSNWLPNGRDPVDIDVA
jgi:hypothetical protein